MTADCTTFTAGRFQSDYPADLIGSFHPTEKLDLAGVDKILRQDWCKPYFSRGFSGVEYAPEGQTYGMAVGILEGKIFVNFGEKDGFDAGTSLVYAVDKLEQHLPLSRHEEYAIEGLFHELLHLQSKNATTLPPIASPEGFPRSVMEAVNQLIARKNYPAFLKQLGGEAQHAEWVLENGYGYDLAVNNLRCLLKTLHIDEDDFLKKAYRELMRDYTDFDKKMQGIIVKMCKRKDSWKAGDAFKSMDTDQFDLHLAVLNQ